MKSVGINAFSYVRLYCRVNVDNLPAVSLRNLADDGVNIINKILRFYHVCFVRRRKHKIYLNVEVYSLHCLTVACKLCDKLGLKLLLTCRIACGILRAVVCAEHNHCNIGSKVLSFVKLSNASVVVCIGCGVRIRAVVGKHGSAGASAVKNVISAAKK